MSNNYNGMCKGCLSNKRCSFQQYDKLMIPICPCRKCLVKGICITSCEEYQKNAHPLFHKDDIKYSGMEGKKL